MAYQDWGSVKSARYAYLHELAAGDPKVLEGSSVRVLGRIVRFDAGASEILIEYNGVRMTVMAALLGDIGKFKKSSLWQFFGELELDSSNSLRLRARIARDASGIETDLYDRCLRVRRRFEAAVFK